MGLCGLEHSLTTLKSTKIPLWVWTTSTTMLQPLADDPARFDYFVAIITSAMIGERAAMAPHRR